MLSNENICSLAAPCPRELSPVRLFVNKERVERFQKNIKKVQCEHQTMGLPEIDAASPQNFMRKHERGRRPKLVELDESERTRACEAAGVQRKPSVPDRFFHDPERCPRDFCSENVNYATSLIPPVLRERIVVGTRGDIVALENSVLRPKYLASPSYGKLPSSVVKFQKKQREKAEFAHKMRELEEKQKTQQLLDHKNQVNKQLLAAKGEWDEKNKEFLLLPVITDTLSSKRKKYLLELCLAKLEDKIKMLDSQCVNASRAWQLHLEQLEMKKAH